MNQNTSTINPQNMSKAELMEFANRYTKNHPPEPVYNGAKNTLFGWTEDGKSVWVLPATKANFERFEDIAKSRPDLGHDVRSHCEIMMLAGAQFFTNWRDSDRARAVMAMRAEPS